jgi:N-acetylglucosaminyl-diphospho-decaprenol L-rhamnosyltransferase
VNDAARVTSPGRFAMCGAMSGTPSHLRVTVVSVCYNSMAVLPLMLASVPEGTRVVIVDNSPEADPALTQLAEGRGAQLVLNRENLGFGVACNIGAAGAETEFLLFLNPDAALAPDALGHLTAAMDRYPKASAANPRIAEADGSPYFKRRSVLIPRREWLPRGWPAADREVPVLSGAALFVRRSAFEAVGGFDSQIFLYHEDDDLSIRLKRDCGPLMFVRDALATHQGGASTARSPEVAAFKGWHMGRSRVYAMRKHGAIYPLATFTTAAVLQTLSPSNFLSRRRRAKQMAFLRGGWTNRQRRS